jgi:hypothetical protein
MNKFGGKWFCFAFALPHFLHFHFLSVICERLMTPEIYICSAERIMLTPALSGA